MNTQLTPRALDVIADSGETGELPLRNAAPGSSGGGSAVVLLEAIEEYLQDQDALDNQYLSGQNARGYFVLVRRRNAARRELDAAIAAAGERT
jgi:hypothetical protein